MATYINYGEGEDDATVQGAEWLKESVLASQGQDAQQAFMDKFRNLHEKEGREYDVGKIFDLFLDYSEQVFASTLEAQPESERKVESFFALVLSMLLMLEDEDHLDQATTRLCESFSSSAENLRDLRLRLLMMLYNTFGETFPFRYRVFKHIIDYSAKAGLFDQVMPYMEHLDTWMVDWDLQNDEKRTLYRDLAKYYRKLNKRVDAFHHLKQFHVLHEGADAKELQAVSSETIDLLRDAIQIPSVIQFDDIVKFDTVKELEKTKSKELVALCRIFLSGTVQDLKDFHKKSSQLFDEHEFNFADSLSKIRLLTLATLAMGKSELTLAEVAEALEEKVENIEEWVVKAISEGFIDGRIDQINHKVLVKSTFQRKFETEEWQFLDSKLTSWIGNLEDVIKFISHQRQLTPTAAASA